MAAAASSMMIFFFLAGLIRSPPCGTEMEYTGWRGSVNFVGRIFGFGGVAVVDSVE